MYSEPVFLKPFFQDRIWGGSNLQKIFNYDIPTPTTGEAWVISGHENGPSIIMNGSLQGKTLTEAWREYPDLFSDTFLGDEFPLLIKILDANDNLSVQVHPDDAFALEMTGKSSGKTECWYILDCEEEAEIILGHRAQSTSELMAMIANQEWNNLFHSIKVKKGDFIYVPSGTIHAIGKGIVILETQQNSDITYRLYDYDRTDCDGKKRTLHLESAVKVTSCPYKELIHEKIEEQSENLVSTRLIQEKYFTVYHWKVKGTFISPLAESFLLISVIEGSGKIITDANSSYIKKGDNFIIPKSIGKFSVDGELELIVSHI